LVSNDDVGAAVPWARAVSYRFVAELPLVVDPHVNAWRG
jgi:hypothetical protein